MRGLKRTVAMALDEALAMIPITIGATIAQTKSILRIPVLNSANNQH
jgi:hypothetical protein